MGPIDYVSLIQAPNFGQSFAQGMQIGEALHQKFNRREGEEAFVDAQRENVLAKQAQDLAAEQAAQERARAYAEEVARVQARPSPEGFRSLLLRYPEQHEALKSAWDGYSEGEKTRNLEAATKLYGYLNAGRSDLALTELQRRKAALAEAGEDTTETDGLIEMIESGDPAEVARAQGFAGLVLSAAVGPDKIGPTLESITNVRQDEEMFPTVKRKAEAEASTAETTAEYAPARAEAEVGKLVADTENTYANIDNIRSQIDERAARLELDRDRLASTIELELTKLAESGAKLSPGMEKEVTDRVVSAEASRMLAERSRSIAERFETDPGSAGAVSWIGDATGISGQQYAAMRREYLGLIGSQAVKNLPPGAASDADIKLAMRGFPPANARPSTIAQFMRGYAKLQEMAANSEQSKADWIANNGNLGTAKRDIWVNGTQIPAGTTYGEFSKTMARVQRREKAAERPYMKYGK